VLILSTPLAMTDIHGKVVWLADYTAFGDARILVEEIRNPLRFLGQYHDTETGLYYNLFRYYDPILGRYITPDPLRYGGGSTNFYQYANNDPVNQRDTDGHIAFLAALGVIGAVALVGGLIGGAISAASAPEGERWDSFKEGFAWGAAAGAVGAAVPIVGAAIGITGASLAALAVGADALFGGIEMCARGGLSASNFLQGAGISLAMTVGTLGLSKIPGVKRALGAVGKRLSPVANKISGRLKQVYYKLRPGELVKKRAARKAAKKAIKEAARKEAAEKAAKEAVKASKSVRFGPMNPGPLADDIANTFRSGTYTARTLDKPTTLYRVIGDTGNPAGSYWTRVKPQGPLQSIIDSALDQNWGNTATRVVEAKIPAGTQIYAGAAAAQRGLVGGGNQIYIPKVDPKWIIQ
jgi:RHS repeat-associated protein